jgi:dTDP-4-dehydrorhamnose 3,5-epimerase
MRFERTELDGAWLIGLEPASDQRGFFARTFCTREFAEHGLKTVFVQHSTSYSTKGGTIRGMHFQRDPAAEVKVVNCVRGAIYDVIIDLRRGSPTYRRWQGFELSAENRRRLYIPAGHAHGFQTLTDDGSRAGHRHAAADPVCRNSLSSRPSLISIWIWLIRW